MSLDYVYGVAIVSRSGQILLNSLFRSEKDTPEVDVLYSQMLLHSSLELLQQYLERNGIFITSSNNSNTPGKSNKVIQPSAEHKGVYTGVLSSIDNIRVYGFVSNTKVNIFVYTSDISTVSDQKILDIIHNIHESYVKVCLNPFYTQGMPITTDGFLSDLTKLIGVPTIL